MDNQTLLLIGNPRLPRDRNSVQASTDDKLPAAWMEIFDNQAISQVAGDFAVGYKAPDGRTFLAVDRFAIRSLCYRIVDGVLRFAARADELADATTAIDPQAIFDYLYFKVIPSPRTIFKGIFRLPPGHFALYENGKLTVVPYWTPQFCEPSTASYANLKEEFRSLLFSAVKEQLDGSKPACFLSGGTDSSTVSGIVEQVCGQPAATYSIGFEAEGYDEMEYARLASRHFRTVHHEYYVTPSDLVASIPLVAGYYDQPFGNSSALPAYYCALMAREDGVSKILAGDGGDELFGGNTRYVKQKVFGIYDKVPAVLRNLFLEPLLLGTPLGRLPLARKGVSYIEQAKVPMPFRAQTYNLLYRLGINNIFTPDFLAMVDIKLPDVEQTAIWNIAITASPINRELAFDWRYTLAECDIPKVVGTTSLAGIQVGFPMLDQKLVEFSMRLPVDYKLNGFKLRWFFKEALRGFLPDEILTKKKQGFGLPFGVWTTKHADLKALAEDSVRRLADRKILSADFVDELFSRYLYEHPGYFGEMIWILMMLEQWLQKHANSFSLR